MISTGSKHKTLLQLSRSPYLHNGQFKELVKEVLVALTFELDVNRAGFWIFQQNKSEVKNLFLYDKIAKEFSSGEVWSSADYPKFYEVLSSKLILKVDDAVNSIVTKEIKEQYVGAYGVKSMLGIQVWHKETILGILLVEQTKAQKKWITHDKIYLTTAASYISQSYSSNLRIKETTLREKTEANYHSVFNDSPVPMLIYDPSNWSILDVNEGAVGLYGYTLEQFKQLTLLDLRAHTKDQRLDAEYKNALMMRWHKSQWTHHRNNGATFLVQISGDATSYSGEVARIATVIDVTADEKAREEKEVVIKKFEDYAFYASHNMRRPLSSIMSLMDLIKMSWDDREGYQDLMTNLQIATMDLDEVIRVMNAKLEMD